MAHPRPLARGVKDLKHRQIVRRVRELIRPINPEAADHDLFHVKPCLSAQSKNIFFRVLLLKCSIAAPSPGSSTESTITLYGKRGRKPTFMPLRSKMPFRLGSGDS